MEVRRGFLYKSVIFLLTLIISILHYTAAPADTPLHNFYRLLYYIPIILAAFNFGFKGGVITSLIIGFIYSPFMLLSVSNFGWQTVSEFLDIILYFAAGIITGTLVEKKNISLTKLDNELKRYVLLENYTLSIIESIKSGVIAVNNDMLITMVNQGAKDILNIDTDCMGQNLTEVFNCCDSVREKIKESDDLCRNNENVEIEIFSNGKELTIKISISPLIIEKSKRGLVIILDDITEMKKLQQQLQRSDRLAALGELSAGIAHEIRNPLGIIKAIEQTMKKELKDNNEAVMELEIIDEEVERANKVVKSLMELGKPSRNERACYSINSVLEEVLAITNKYMLQHNVIAELNKDKLPDVYIDKEQIKQAFINIILNAVQAMPDGGKLTIKTQILENLKAAVVFEDSGKGIEEENLEKIFNPFFTTKDEGTGLGLSIVHRIIEEHGGTINAFSKKGTGTRFEILLPLMKEDYDEKDFNSR